MAVDKNGKIRFDRRQYDLDFYADIMETITNLDYQAIEDDGNYIKIAYADAKKAKEETAIKYDDKLTVLEIAHLESDIMRRCLKC